VTGCDSYRLSNRNDSSLASNTEEANGFIGRAIVGMARCYKHLELGSLYTPGVICHRNALLSSIDLD